MNAIRFGGPLGSVFDKATGVTAHPRCVCELELVVRDPNAYGACVAQMGGEEALSQAIQQTALKHLGAALAERTAEKGLMTAMSNAQPLSEKTSAGVDLEIASIGATVRIGSIMISLPEEDVTAIKAVGAQAARKKIQEMQQQSAAAASPAVLAPGTRVIARWNDGREFGATVQKWTGTHYEIAWDGGGNAFVGADAVRPAS
jgi:hypothetical protein